MKRIDSRTVVIVGGGIGGLACGLMLHARGIPCVVFEQSSEIRELGVGINLLPHAVSKLVPFGLLDHLERISLPTTDLIYMNRMGQIVWSEPRGRAAGYDVPQFSIHRGRLQTALLNAFVERGGDIRTGFRLTNLLQTGAHATCEFETSEGMVRVDAAAVVGADGIHSRTRKILTAVDEAPHWNGIIILRGATDWPAFLDGQSMLIAGGMRAKGVIYPIAAGSTPGHRLTNWAINIKTGPDGSAAPLPEDWSRHGDRETLIQYARMFSFPQIDIVKLVPLYPTGSNGAGQAILDADCLASCLAAVPDIAAALVAYEHERLPATAEIVRRNRIGGPETVIDVVEERAPQGFDDIDRVLSYIERKRIVEDYATTARFSIADVNQAILRS